MTFQKIIDLSYLIHPDMPVFPGTPKPKFDNAFQIAQHGFAEKVMTLATHTGTHMDAPAHIIPGGKTLDNYPVSCFSGTGCKFTAHRNIKPADLEALSPILEKSDFLLIETGWPKYWGSASYFQSFPVLTEQAAEYLAGMNLKGVGVDAISVDPADSTGIPVHKILLKAEILIIENLTNLDQLPESGFLFNAFPLSIKNADGSPVRAVGMV